jgi:hypothetical protein
MVRDIDVASVVSEVHTFAVHLSSPLLRYRRMGLAPRHGPLHALAWFVV